MRVSLPVLLVFATLSAPAQAAVAVDNPDPFLFRIQGSCDAPETLSFRHVAPRRPGAIRDEHGNDEVLVHFALDLFWGEAGGTFWARYEEQPADGSQVTYQQELRGTWEERLGTLHLDRLGFAQPVREDDGSYWMFFAFQHAIHDPRLPGVALTMDAAWDQVGPYGMPREEFCRSRSLGALTDDHTPFLFQAQGSCEASETLSFRHLVPMRPAAIPDEWGNPEVLVDLTLDLFPDGTYWARIAERPADGSPITFQQDLEGTWEAASGRILLDGLGWGQAAREDDGSPWMFFAFEHAVHDPRLPGVAVTLVPIEDQVGPRGLSLAAYCE